MNHIYKTFYNQNKRTYVVGSETSKTHKKSQATCISALICGLILSTTSFAATNIKIFGTTTVSSGSRNDSLFLLGNDKALQLDRKGINTITTTSNSVSFGKGNSQNGFFKSLESGTSYTFIHELYRRDKDNFRISGCFLEKLDSGAIKQTDGALEISCTDPANAAICQKLRKNIPKNGSSLFGGNNKKLIDEMFSNNPSINATQSKWDEYIYEGTVTRKLINVSNGTISATSTDAVNGSQLYELKKELGAGSEYISVNATDNSASPITSAKAQGAHATAVGETAIASGSNSLAIGHNATTSTAASNSIALGAGSQANEADIVSVGSDTVKRRVTNLAEGVSATDAATVGQIGKIASSSAKDAVVVDDGTNTTVTLDTAGGKNTYKVNVVADGKIASGDTGIVTGDTVHKKFEEFTQTTNTQLSGFAKTDGSNIDVNNGQWLTALGSTDGQSIVKGNKHFVSGEQVFSEVRPTDGTHVKNANTTAQNLNQLDSQVSTNTQQINQNKSQLTTEIGRIDTALNTKANVDASNINSGKWIEKLGSQNNVAIQNNNAHFVSGQQVYNEVRPTNGTYVQNTQTTAQNLNALDANLKQTSDTLKNKVNASDVGNLIDGECREFRVQDDYYRWAI